MFVRLSAWNNTDPTGRIFMKFDIWGFFSKNFLRKFKFNSKLTRITGTLHEELCTFMIISRWILLGMRNASDKVVQKIKTYILCSIISLRKSWDNVEKCGTAREATDDNIIQRMRFACRINKATIHTLTIFNTYCFSTVTIVTRTCLNVTLIRTFPVLYFFACKHLKEKLLSSILLES
jgi:hypothetical protein